MMQEKTQCRLQRVNNQLQRSITEIVRHSVRDPRVREVPITITRVEVSRDLSHAKVFLTCMDAPVEELMRALKSAAPFIRSQLMQKIQLRLMPNLKFIYDSDLVEGTRLVSLIEKAVSLDAQ